MNRSDLDVVVVGAGVAGLAAARTLRRAASGLRIAVLEARNRVGGRIFTVHDDAVSAPIELGAEFVHGTAIETVAAAREAQLVLAEVLGERWQSHGRHLTRLHDFWGQLNRVMRRLSSDRKEDRTFAEFLASRPGGRQLAAQRALAKEFVEGFHAADASQISERSLAEGGSPSDDPDEQRMARVLSGYDAVPAFFCQDLRDVLQLRTPVRGITWERGRVRLTVSSHNKTGRSFIARAAIVTVPLGVLLARDSDSGALHFDPSSNQLLSAASGMRMGHVMRITLRFNAPFWEDIERIPSNGGDSLALMSFLHTQDRDVPVWWTALPIRSST